MLGQEELNYDSELVFATVGGVGVDHSKISRIIKERLEKYQYITRIIKISEDIIPKLTKTNPTFDNVFDRGMKLMDGGNTARKKFKNNGILALATVSDINANRKRTKEGYFIGRNAYVISSLKRPEELHQLRNIYNRGFYLFGIHSSAERRKHSLVERRFGMTAEQAELLMERDENEEKISGEDFGQKTRNTFHLADFFLEDDGDEEKLRNEIDRIIDLIFGHPYITPTFNEYAMFQAFSASLRSADLSRQVGAVIALGDEIISSGANDCPKATGGLYWPIYSESKKQIVDFNDGRDFTRGFDTNAKALMEIIEQITKGLPIKTKSKVEKAIRESNLPSLTEFGRMVHAEMEAILNCARNLISCRGGTLYATTFPCHNCAKHIIASGIKRVVYVEPYPKSRALSFYTDAISTNPKNKTKVIFSPFMGVGPRQFFNLFSMNLSSGRKLVRKDEKTANIVTFDYATAEPRISMRTEAYLQFEEEVSAAFNNSPPKPKMTRHGRTKSKQTSRKRKDS